MSPARAGVVVLAFVAALLALAASLHELGHDTLAIGAAVLAIGAENAPFQRDGEVAIGLTYVTGTLVKAAQRLTGALFGEGRWGWLPYVSPWGGLVGGAVLGAMAYAHLRLDGLWSASLAVAGLAIAAAVRPALVDDAATTSAANLRAS